MMSRTKRRRNWRWLGRWGPALLAGGAVGFVAAADGVVRPLHQAGWGQGWGAWVNGLARLVELPGLFVAGVMGFGASHHISTGGRIVMVCATGPIFYLAGVIPRWIWRGTRRGDGVGQAAVAERSPTPWARVSRRQALRAGAMLAAAGAAGISGYAFAIEPRRFQVARRVILIRDLPRALDGLTIAQLTDIHHGPWTSVSDVRAMVEAANALKPDLIALTGDYVHQSPAYIAPVTAELGRLRARAGVVATLGNHDWWEDGWKTIEALGRNGIPLVDNGRRFLTPDRRLQARPPDGGGLCIAGVGDLWEGSPDYDAALGGVPKWMPRLLLSHNPDVAEERKFLSSGHRVDLMLSGHTHGGQVRVPGLGAPMIPSRYGQKYAAGLVAGPACRVFISRGLGTTIMPLRLGVPPEIAVIELRRADTAAGKSGLG